MANYNLHAIIKYLEHGTMPSSFDKNHRAYMKRKSALFILKNKQLFHKRPKMVGDLKTDMLSRVLITPEEIKNTIKFYHLGINDTTNAESLEGHLGYNRTQAYIAQRFWWPNMTKDIRTYVMSCSCHTIIDKSNDKPLTRKTTICLKSWEKVGIDLCKFSTTKCGNMYMLVAIDYFSKWIEARPMQSCTARETIKNLLDILCRCGFPKVIVSHHGHEFVNSITKDFFVSTGIQHEIISTDHSLTENSIAKANQIILDTLIKVLQSDTRDWDCILPGVMRALLTTKQRSTTFTPWMLMWGREPDDLFSKDIKEEKDIILEDSNDAFNDVLRLKVKGNQINSIVLRTLHGTHSRRKTHHKKGLTLN